MTSFISQILEQLLSQEKDISTLIFVLPSKRAGAYLRKELGNLVDRPIISPKVISIEEFSEKVSGLKAIDSVHTLFELYAVYKELTPKEQLEDFESFGNWAQTLIHDFNEIDRYLIDPMKIFSYLFEIQDKNHWSLGENQTDIVKNYLTFWKKLPEYYSLLKRNLLSKSKGYQGLIYRHAAENIEEFAKLNAENYVFLGFNALNNAEQHIIQSMLANKARIFWDIDEVFLKDDNHDASLFIRQYHENWPYYKTNKFEFASNTYNTEKEIEIIGVPKNIGQVKFVAETLSELTKDQLNSTALVLGDESLLLPMLNSIPPNIEDLNITMGYPLKYSVFSSFFEKLFEIYQIENNKIYYKDVIAVLNSPLVIKATNFGSEKVINKIKTENLLYLSKQQIEGFFPAEHLELISTCFHDVKLKPAQVLQRFEIIIQHFKALLNKDEDSLSLEFLYHYHLVVQRLTELITEFPHFTSLVSLLQYFRELSSQQSLDFQGKPFQGLQLMGMLETRGLDFETIILTSVNEGILPAGKSNNSFIPYDLKKTFNLPTYKEKDAIYTYHFYHLLHRAKKIYLLHDTDTESQMGSEKSRFLLQLLHEQQPAHKITTSIISPEVPVVNNELQKIQKTPEILEKLMQLAGRGFSPSALTTYIRNPLDFYKQYILGIRDNEEVEETVAYNTLGTVVHDTLEAFYKPFIGKPLRIEKLKDLKKSTAKEVKVQFEKTYSKAPLNLGKNLLIFEVAKRYVINFLNMEIKQLEAGKNIIVKEVESDLSLALSITGLDFPVHVRGKVDRVDLLDGVLRIVDYKTGKVTQNQLEIADWDLLTTDYDKYSKPFQVLTYATMLLNSTENNGEVEAGVISFKNLKEGFMKFSLKEKQAGKPIKNSKITEEILNDFHKQLSQLILEICNPEIPFIEKEIKPAYGAY
ncbi:PD-(D/E)XK nuclease superfamily protein [Gillisia sp. Hel_I_86]|uniref:PD-(D/E)XK nuclease family protein n=1 Tax=Gillisia sp. Hel_I_86 TaxID=1249981 RepID=UPI0011991250|nr:PD-(D/E)XK nuclease family protein [Gillisia sp. Hel_I_86]TVZ26366.1 PD-(D/E)XK nuclease superfamily protein [Gillisia sp. Hel_I_86]